MFELTTCAIVRPDGRDCDLKIMEGATVPLCPDHMREAYLFFAGHLQSLREFGEQQRDDWSKVGIQEGIFPPERPEVVYYVLIGHHVKIGTTRDMQSRMTALSPDEILALEPGGREVEQVRHRQFRALLAKGREYFHPGAALQEHVRQLQEIGWHPPAPPVEVPGPVVGHPCPSCQAINLWHDGTSISCDTCSARVDIPGYPPAGHIRRQPRAVDLR